MKPRAFCEFPAGLAAVSLRLHGGPHCRPPISRMGNKAGYAEVILAAMGLRSGEGAGAYLWAEADPDVRALLRAYPDAEMLRKIAEVIRGWADEEPRALWERLRAERKARGPTEGPECGRLAAYAQIVASNRLIHVAGPELTNTGVGGTTFGGPDFATPAADVAAGFERVAGWVVSSTWSYEQGNVATGYCGPGDRRQDTTATATATSRLAERGRWPPVAVLPAIPTAAEVATWLGTPGDLDGVVTYMDPPYVGTTGYGAVLTREEVIAHARDFDALGAVVCISEAEPVIDGWHATEITGGRKGQKRTFSKQQREWLTMNRAPAATVAVQVGMFG